MASFVLRDGHSIPILASGTQLGYADVLIVEATTLRKCLRQALCKGYDTIHVEGDSILQIQAINWKMHAPWRIKLLVLDILKLTDYCAQITFTHVLWEANFLANAITNLNHDHDTQLWEQTLLPSPIQAYHLDQIQSGVGCPKDFVL